MSAAQIAGAAFFLLSTVTPPDNISRVEIVSANKIEFKMICSTQRGGPVPSSASEMGEVAAIHRQCMAGDIGGCGRGEEYDGAGDLGRRAPAAERGALLQPGRYRRIGGQAGIGFSREEARRHGV